MAPEWEARVLVKRLMPVMFLLEPVISPPNVKALIVLALRAPAVTKLPAVTENEEVNDLLRFKEPAKVEEPVPESMMLPVVMVRPEPVIPVAVKDLERLSEPRKELEAVPETVSCFPIVRWPPKELEAAVLVALKMPVVSMPAACKPLERVSEPKKELEPVLEDV